MTDMSTEEDTSFEDALDKGDFGFIVCSVTGKLKGLWIPQEMGDVPVPDTIIRLCVDYFGIDPEEFDENYEYNNNKIPRILH